MASKYDLWQIIQNDRIDYIIHFKRYEQILFKFYDL